MPKLSQKNPVISVVIPALNEEKLVSLCLDSLQKQDFKKPFEVIIVDGGSTDKTAEIVRRHGAKIVKQKGKGIGDARFLGYEKAKAEIIVNTDADTTFPKNWLRTIFKYFENNPEIGALAGVSELAVESKPLIRILFKFLTPIAKLTAFLTGFHYFSGRNSAIRKTVYKKTGGFNRRLKCSEDFDLSLRAGKVTKIAHLPQLKVITVDRRWQDGYLKYLFGKLLPGFFFNAVLKKPNNRFNRWERVD